MNSRGNISIVSCESGKNLTNRICKSLDMFCEKLPEAKANNVSYKWINTEEITFANGEIKTIIKELIRGTDLYIVQCVDDPHSKKSVNDNIMALMTTIDACYQSDPEYITVIIPQYPYSRQERRLTREGITAKQIAQILQTTGADRVITMDIHSEAIAGFFQEIKFENISAINEFTTHFLKNYKPKNELMVVAPDIGSAARGRQYAKFFGDKKLAIIDKVRDYSTTSTISAMTLVGDVEGYDVFMGDDLISTGGTMINACKLLKDKGAKDIYIACTFPFFNNNAYEKFSKAYEDGLFKKLLGTDCVFWGENFAKEHPWYDEVSVARLFANIIFNINTKQSISKLLGS